MPRSAREERDHLDFGELFKLTGGKRPKINLPKPEPVTMAIGEKALRFLAEANGKSIKEMRAIIDDCGRAGMRAVMDGEKIDRNQVSNKQKVAAVRKYQRNHKNSPLVCQNDRSHLLEAKEVGRLRKKVILICHLCNFKYEHIPRVILLDYLANI